MDEIFKNVDPNLVGYWKSFGLSERDFYCRECGRLLIDLDETGRIRYRPEIKDFRSRFVDVSTEKRYVESEYSRWCVKGRDLSGKTYFRHLCWDCFFRHLPEIEDIPRRARKSTWYAAVLRGEHTVPKAWTSPSEYFKILFDITDDELQCERSKFDTASLESFVRRYGDADGAKKYEEYRRRQAYTCSKEYMMTEKNMSAEDWENYNASRASTKENFVKRYGKELGEAKWEKYREREAYAGCTLEYFQTTYGHDAGTKYYYDVCHQKAVTLSNFIKKYGYEAGKSKYEKMMHRPDRVGYSAISQNLFAAVDARLGDSAAESKWETKNLEQDIEIEIDGVKKFAKPDYILGRKIIEFNGDYWHANPVYYKSTDSIQYPEGTKLASEIWLRDAKRLNALKGLGYEVLVVWENEYDSDRDLVVQKCVQFLRQ